MNVKTLIISLISILVGIVGLSFNLPDDQKKSYTSGSSVRGYFLIAIGIYGMIWALFNE